MITMRTTYEIDCLKFSKLSISSPPGARKEYRNSTTSAVNHNNNTIGHSADYNRHNGTQSHNGYKPLLPRLEFPTNQFDRLLHMDSKEFKNGGWRSNGFVEKKKK
ncbi:hypothetical protein BLOT_012555 [Blomia tropicalis]|nr:hypothetical protein BLOT_012555 [Blomia tropicalis]